MRKAERRFRRVGARAKAAEPIVKEERTGQRLAAARFPSDNISPPPIFILAAAKGKSKSKRYQRETKGNAPLVGLTTKSTPLRFVESMMRGVLAAVRHTTKSTLLLVGRLMRGALLLVVGRRKERCFSSGEG